MRPVLFQYIAAFALTAAAGLGTPAFAQQPAEQPQAQPQPQQAAPPTTPAQQPQQQAAPPAGQQPQSQPEQIKPQARATIQPPSQATDIAMLAAQLAGEIRKAHPAPTTIAVVNFQGPQQAAAPFGVWLADQFSDALAKAMPDSRLADRTELKNALQSLSLPLDDQPSDAIAKALQRGATINDATTVEKKLRSLDLSGNGRLARIAQNLNSPLFVTGSFGAMGSGIGISLKVLETKHPDKMVCSIPGLIALTPEITNHINVPLDSLWPLDGIFTTGTAGVSLVRCRQCPDPVYTPDAFKRRHVGTSFLTAVVAIDGTLTDVKLLRTSGDAGLDQKAIETVRMWKLTPARGADDLLRPVRVNIDVTFKILAPPLR